MPTDTRYVVEAGTPGCADWFEIDPCPDAESGQASLRREAARKPHRQYRLVQRTTITTTLLMHTIDPVTGDILLHSDGDIIRLDPETAAYLLGETHLIRTLERLPVVTICRLCERPIERTAHLPEGPAPTCADCALELEHDGQHRMTSDYDEAA